MRVELISIGQELLWHEVLDTRAAYIVRFLRELGVELTSHITVGDQQGRIASVIGDALARAEVVLTVGGLGFRSDDFTRRAIAEVAERDLTAQPPGVSGGRRLGAESNSVYGLLLEAEWGTIISLPGDQRDVAYLLQTEVLPYLESRLPRHRERGALLLRTAGAMESSIRQQLADLRMGAGEQLSFSSVAGQTDIRLLVTAVSPEAVAQRLERLAGMVEARLGDLVYGRNQAQLEEIIVDELRRRGLRLAVAEYETGQVLARIIDTVPSTRALISFIPLATHEGISHYLGVAPELVSKDITQWCREVAERLRSQTGADLGLVVYNNRTQSGTQILVTLATAQGASFTQRAFGGHPTHVDLWAGTLALVQLRHWLLAHSYPAAPVANELL